MPFFRCILLLLCLACAGCRPASREQADEQKESFYLLAKKRLQERDYQGAIESFEKALDVNPRSASAHFELGVLYDQQQNDYAAALYHYQRTLAFRPDFPAAAIVKDQIEQCKRELAKSVVQLPTVEVLQREVDALRVENQQLKRQVEAWQNYYAGRGITLSNVAPAPTNPAARPAAPVNAARVDPAPVPPRTNPVPPTRASITPRTTRTHVVVSGDTLASIARRYGVKLTALQAANPHVDALRLRLGQTIVVPAAAP